MTIRFTYQVLHSFTFLSFSFRTELTPENPLWVGAWWIGFLAGGAAALLIALPILGYPRQLPGATHKPSTKEVKWPQSNIALASITISLSLSGRLSAVCGHACLRGAPAKGWQSGHSIWSSVWKNRKRHAQVTNTWPERGCGLRVVCPAGFSITLPTVYKAFRSLLKCTALPCLYLETWLMGRSWNCSFLVCQLQQI